MTLSKATLSGSQPKFISFAEKKGKKGRCRSEARLKEEGFIMAWNGDNDG